MKKNTRTLRHLLALALTVGAGGSQAESLIQIYQLAEQNAPQIRASAAGLDAAREAIPQSRANFLPSVGVGASASAYSNDYVDDTQSAFINLSQNIYNRAYNVQSDNAQTTVAVAEAEYEVSRQQLVLDVATAYFNVLGAEDNLTFAEAEKQANARQLEQTQQRFEVGLIAITDVHESQAAYDSSVAQAIAAANNVDSSREQLRELTGQYHTRLAKLDEKLPLNPPDPGDPAQWTATAAQQNPTLLAAAERSKQAGHNVDLQGASNYPSADLSLTHTESTSDSLTADGTAAVLSLTYSLYDGNRTKANVSQARQQLRQSQEVYEQTRRATERQVSNAYRGVISNISQVQALRQAVISNQSALRAAEAGYEVGTRTTVDVLVARRNLFAAQRDYAQARYNYVLNTLQLQQAAGTLDAESLRKLDMWLR